MGDFIMEQEDKNMQAEPSEAQENPKKQPQPKGYEAYLSLFDLVRMLAVITLVFVFFFRLNGVSGSSMYPTLVDKDYLVLESNFLYRDAKQGDIVVLYTPPFSENDELLVKRVIAVAAALSPADVKSVTLLPGSTKACRVIVPDDQLSLAIGKEGQNARLAARLTGYKIDIKPASQEQELEAIDAQPDAAPEDAEPQA